MGGMTYKDFWFGSNIVLQVTWNFHELRTLGLIQLYKMFIIIRSIQIQMIFSCLCAIFQAGFFFFHVLLNINFGASMWKKNLVSKEIDNKFPYSFLSQGYDPIFFLEASLFLAFSS